MEDQEIIALYISRNEKAIDETEKAYGQYCRTVAFNILCNNEDAEEAVNETWLGAWNSIPPAIPKVLRLYLARITRNICTKIVRSAKTVKRGNGETDIIFDEISECIHGHDNTQDIIEARELSVFLNSFVESLSETERKIFIRRYWFFETTEQISKQYGFSASKVKSMLLRTRKKLKTKLEKAGLL